MSKERTVGDECVMCVSSNLLRGGTLEATPLTSQTQVPTPTSLTRRPSLIQSVSLLAGSTQKLLSVPRGSILHVYFSRRFSFILSVISCFAFLYWRNCMGVLSQDRDFRRNSSREVLVSFMSLYVNNIFLTHISSVNETRSGRSRGDI